ncbi:hypothetical protein ASPWEDRAFT_46957 [Aspergillus wentii DTO 134E9]|uniref:Carboxyphosphonoenolpyruvate phosphonomutase-like protein n=1 Tax=Aspergillus wentii DTO 134E9 TaxID=1073089 RepID=A0A1L9RYF0_ASPWE|nr:uncharacterized protein ASPWEDRAFT_46957 [Aspergillus wentii DTO 134E9]KAI9932422.1 hypothetical protein MW887_008663 [Aspergillus wentii]OJJ39990.1 hypothetical protein ASPWEDRAFT_46957 [Aspergillus wentii DTO 134E9]
MSAAQNALALYFRNLHIPGQPLVLTNVYDAATASLIASHPSTKAIATASYAIAASQGVNDSNLTRSQNLATVRSIAAALKPSDTQDSLPSFPLTVDVQDGYDDIAETIKQLIQLGAVGCNLEDLDNRTGQLRPLPDAIRRIKQALQTATELGVPDFVINARTDVLDIGVNGQRGTIEDAIERGKAFLHAGATTVFVWGGAGGRGVSKEEVKQLVVALEGKLNVKMVLKHGFLTVPELREIGVARISVGPELYRAAMRSFKETADAVLDGCI